MKKYKQNKVNKSNMFNGKTKLKNKLWCNDMIEKGYIKQQLLKLKHPYTTLGYNL